MSVHERKLVIERAVRVNKDAIRKAKIDSGLTWDELARLLSIPKSQVVAMGAKSKMKYASLSNVKALAELDEDPEAALAELCYLDTACDRAVHGSRGAVTDITPEVLAMQEHLDACDKGVEAIKAYQRTSRKSRGKKRPQRCNAPPVGRAKAVEASLHTADSLETLALALASVRKQAAGILTDISYMEDEHRGLAERQAVADKFLLENSGAAASYRELVACFSSKPLSHAEALTALRDALAVSKQAAQDARKFRDMMNIFKE